jgi:beta-lactamase regulating signal transducer with metallopeptidase domain
MNTAIITSWLLTYLVHSTILLGAAWLISRALADRRLALQEILLRVALIGGLITATLQVGFGVEPIGGAFAVDGLAVMEDISGSGGAATDSAAGDVAVPASPIVRTRSDSIWPTALLSLWVIGSLLALLVLGRSILDLRRLLKTRRFRPTGRLLDRLAAAMGLRRPVRLSTSAAIAVPFATGIRQPEICCPERVAELASEHQKSLFAHELAHLARRDPAWQLLYRLGEALLFLQPLNRFVRRRLEEIAEHLTDERAVACTGNRLGLARCLVVVAHWGVADSPGVPATAFAAGPRLDRRVKRLISGTIGRHRNARWTAPLLVAVLIGSVLLLPAVVPTAVHANLSPSGSDAAPVQPWSPAKPAAETPATPAPLTAPPASDLPRPVAPVAESAPVLEAVPRPAAAPRSVAAPAPSAEPAPAAAPEPRSEPAPPPSPEPQTEPAPPASPTTPEPPPTINETTTVEPGQRERAREEARNRQREAHRERSEAEARARAEVRAHADEARDLAREAAERSRLTEAEREKLRSEARELMRQAEIEAREHMRMARERIRLTEAEREKLRREARELARQAQTEARERATSARERHRLTEAEREELRRRAEALRAESRERAREASLEARERARAAAEEARRLAEEAEAERRAEEDRRKQQKPE